MSRIEKAKEIKKIVTEVIGYNVNVELTIELNEFYVYTPLWQIGADQLERIKEHGVTVLSVFIDGGKIALWVKW